MGVSQAARAVRMVDVADSAGVSRATVSLVMRGDPRITEETATLVLAEAERLGYVYNQAAANLRTQRSNLVALVMPDVVNPFVGEVSMGVQQALTEFGYFVVIANTNDDLARQRSIIRSLVEQRVAGIVTIPVLGTTQEDAGDLARVAIPIVLLTRELPGSDLPSVSPNDRLIGRLGSGHLLDVHHCRRVAYFGGNRRARPRKLRWEGFTSTLRRIRRHTPDVILDKDWSVPFDPGVREAYSIASSLLEQGPPPDGVLCHSDQAAYGMLRALTMRGFTPRDCHVLGIDNLDYSDLWTPSVSTVAVEPRELGRISGDLLLNLMGRSTQDVAPLPAPKLVLRDSCGCGK